MIELEGGCLVSELREGAPAQTGTRSEWLRVGRQVGAEAISLRTLEFAHGRSPAMRSASCDEILYVVSGAGTLSLDGQPIDIGTDTGVYVTPGRVVQVTNPAASPLVIASSRCPEPGDEEVLITVDAVPNAEPQHTPAETDQTTGGLQPVARLGDQQRETTGDRWYCTLIGKEHGSIRATQFVGAIPPGRAPDHFHHYEEVICILRGRGRMWAGRTHAPIASGSCVFLPRRQVHCVENTGDTELVLLGVFYPAGSPAVRYDTGSPPVA